MTKVVIGALVVLVLGAGWFKSPAAAATCSASSNHITFNLGCHSNHPPSTTGTDVGDVQEAPALPDAQADVGACGAAGVNDPQACQAAQPQVTPGVVAQAFQKVPVPHLTSVTQPAGKTLVNFDTIFYVDAQPFDTTLTLLGQQVTLHVRPVSYAWDHGDGVVTTTTVPGAPYPRKDVVYRYQRSDVTVRHHVSVTWAATFQVNGGPAADVPGTVTTVGPDTAIRVVEATPVLTGDR